MKKEIILTDKASQPKGPYSQAVKYNGLLFISGQIAIKPNGEAVHGTIEEEAEVVLQNLKAIIEEAGYTMEDVLKTTCFLTDINEFARFNEIYKKYFTKDFPARSTFQVAALPLGFKIEVEAIAGK